MRVPSNWKGRETTQDLGGVSEGNSLRSNEPPAASRHLEIEKFRSCERPLGSTHCFNCRSATAEECIEEQTGVDDGQWLSRSSLMILAISSGRSSGAMRGHFLNSWPAV